jgi:hypothetical protein
MAINSLSYSEVEPKKVSKQISSKLKNFIESTKGERKRLGNKRRKKR